MNNQSWNQGRNDAQQGKAPANNQNRSSQQRENYNAGYHHQKQQYQQNRTGKK